FRPDEQQADRRQQCQETCQHIEQRRRAIARQQRQHERRDQRDEEDRAHRIELREESGERHWFSPRKRSSACTSTVSKRSRMRNRKMPITMKATRTEKATLISTTSGMPLAPAAARMRPFSIDISPTTWLTALRRLTIISRPSSTTDKAKARSCRARASAAAVTRS